MNDIESHPFAPGVRVAISDDWDNWHEGTVEKLYKNGRFTLKGSTRQWRASSPSRAGRDYWRGHQTGSSWSRSVLRVWDAQADIEIKEIFAAQSRKIRWKKLREQFERIHPSELTDKMLDQIETALKTAQRG